MLSIPVIINMYTESAPARPKFLLNKCLFKYMISVIDERIGSPVPFVKICGTSNICKPPISDVIITYTKIGLSNGRVIF